MNNKRYISAILLLTMGTMHPAWDCLPSFKTMIPWIGFAGALCWGGWNQRKVQNFKPNNNKNETNDKELGKMLAEAGVGIYICEHNDKYKLKKITIGDAYTYTPANQRHVFVSYAMKKGEGFDFFDLPGVELFSIENKEGKWSRKMDEKLIERCLSQDWTTSE